MGVNLGNALSFGHSLKSSWKVIYQWGGLAVEGQSFSSLLTGEREIYNVLGMGIRNSLFTSFYWSIIPVFVISKWTPSLIARQPNSFWEPPQVFPIIYVAMNLESTSRESTSIERNEGTINEAASSESNGKPASVATLHKQVRIEFEPIERGWWKEIEDNGQLCGTAKARVTWRYR